MEKPTESAELERFRGEYLEALAAIRYQDVTRMQKAPHASLAHGALGVAFALERLGRRHEDDAILAGADRWLGWVRADRGMDAFGWGGHAGRHPHSLLSGPAGAALCEALVADALGERARVAAAVDAYVRHCEGALADGDPEVFEGIAGMLLGLVGLMGLSGGAGLAGLGHRLSEALAAAGDAQFRTRRSTRVSFAHGWPGTLYAALVWAHVTATPLAAPLADRLDALAALDVPETLRRTYGRDERRVAASWCNGAAGLTLLWTAAHRVMGDERSLARARQAVAVAAAAPAPDTPATLCCGTAGRAYAVAAFAACDPNGPWRERAVVLARRLDLDTPYPSGLMWGYPGLLCLADDLLEGEPVMPVFGYDFGAPAAGR